MRLNLFPFDFFPENIEEVCLASLSGLQKNRIRFDCAAKNLSWAFLVLTHTFVNQHPSII